MKNSFTSIKLEEQYKTSHSCIEINQNDIKVYNDTKENHMCKCPFFRLFLTNYRNSIKLNSEDDEIDDFSYVGTESLSSYQEDMLRDAGIDPDDLKYMDDDEVREALEDAGLDVDDFTY